MNTFSFIDERLSQKGLDIDPRTHVRQASCKFDKLVRIAELRFAYQLKIDKITYSRVSRFKHNPGIELSFLSTEVKILPKNYNLAWVSWLYFRFNKVKSNQDIHELEVDKIPNQHMPHTCL